MNPLVEERLVQLKLEGVAPVAAIKAIHIEFGLSLAAAKQVFAESSAWAIEAANAQHLHEQVFKVLDGLSGQ